MKNAVKVISFAALLVLSITVAYRVLSFKDTMGLVGSSIRQIAYTEDNKIDVAFVGSSHVFAGIRPDTLWNEFGIASFDMSVSGMDMDSAYHHTKYMLETQSPQYVFLDLYSLTFDEHAVIENQYRNYLGLPFSKNNYELVNEFFDDPDERLDYQIRWPVIHTRYKELTFNDFKDLGFARYGRGERFVLGAGASIYNGKFEVAEIAELDEKRMEWLEKFKALSEEYNFKLVFIVIPFSVSETDQACFNAVEQFANENGITYFDFNRRSGEVGFDFASDSSDAFHLNTSGAEKLSRWLGIYLAYEECIETHQGEDGYDYWDLDAAYLSHTNSINFLSTLYNGGDIEGFFRTLNGIPGISFVITMDGEWNKSETPYTEYMELVGADPTEAESGGVWIRVSGGEIEHIAANDDTEVHIVDLDEITSVRIARSEAEIGNEVRIGNNSGQKFPNGISVSVYDNVNYRYVSNWYFY